MIRKMNKEEENSSKDSKTKQAKEILKALNHFEYPKEVDEIENWLSNTKPLQSLVKKLCENDKTGTIILECVNLIFELIATCEEAVSPAIWEVLAVVENFVDVQFFTENFQKYSSLSLKNALNALLQGVCYCGNRIPVLQIWCLALINYLEEKQKYSVFLAISHSVLFKLLNSLVLPYSRKTVYPILENLLYPMPHPQAFDLIVEEIPNVLEALDDDENEEMREIFYSFCGLIKIMVGRFSSREGKNYENLKAALSKYPQSMFKYPSKYPLFNYIPKNDSNISHLLECPVCYTRFVTPVMSCKNGHCICSNCKEQIQNCPICRAQFSNIKMTILDQIIEETEFYCKNFDLGCNVKLLYKDIWDHEMHCEYRTVCCEIKANLSSPKLICNEEVVSTEFHKHIEKFHKTCVAKFTLNTERTGQLERKETNTIKLLKDSENNLYFIEKIYATYEEILFSYHYMGKNSEAKNYIYTIKINGKGGPQKIQYSNFCLPNYMAIPDTEINERCLFLPLEKILDFQQSDFEYTVKIEDFISFKLKN